MDNTRKGLQIFLAFWLILAPVFAAAGDSSSSSTQQPACQILETNGGYFFDNYEQHEYVNGFLVLHLKLKTPYNDGRAWFSSFNLFATNCSPFSSQLTLTGFTPRASMQFYSIRFTSLTHFEFWDDEQEVQIKCGAAGSCAGDLPATLPDGSSYSSISYTGMIDGGASSIFTSSFAVAGTGQAALPPKEPILIIPGILGSELTQTGELVWPNLIGLVTDPASGFLDVLNLDQNGRPVNADVKPGNIISKINYSFGSYDYSAALIDEFGKAGYSLNQNLFVFPYDWRLSIADNALLLGTDIKNILVQTGAAKVNIVAHSLGGLVLKEYLANAASPAIDNVVFVGVPNLGSAEAAHELIFGSNLGIPLLSAGEMQRLAQNMPSIFELLPSQKYFTHTAGFYDDLTAQNSPILDYGQSKNLLSSLGKNLSLLNSAEILHSTLDNFDFRSKVGNIYNIVGCGQFTLKTINKMRAGSSNILARILYGPTYRISGDSGDGTVLMSSATDVPGANTFYVHAVHSKMLGADGSRQAIVQFASGQFGSGSVVPAGLAADSGSCGIQGKLVSLNSALNISITNALTGQPINLSTLPQIGTGGDTHIFLPTDSGQQYKVAVKPSDSITPVDLSIAKVQPAQTTIYNYNQINLQKEADAQITPDTNTVDNVDPSGVALPVAPSQVEDQNNLGNLPDNSSSAASSVAAPQQNVDAPVLPATILSSPPIIYLPAPAPVESPLAVSGSVSQPQDSGIVSVSSTPGDSSADPADNDGSTTISPQPNINITFQFPPGLLALQSAQDQQPNQDNSADNSPDQIDSGSDSGDNPGQTVFVGQVDQPFFWAIIEKLFHLIFF